MCYENRTNTLASDSLAATMPVTTICWELSSGAKQPGSGEIRPTGYKTLA